MRLEKKLRKIAPNGKAMILAYDQGFEHGPRDFEENPESVNPEFIIRLAEAEFTGLVLHAGIAEKYWHLIRRTRVPLILKLNGKSELYTEDDPYSPQLYSVQDAIDLGATAIGYTVYVGSKYEAEMIKEFAQIIREAHQKELPVVGWMYPRGKALKEGSSETSRRAQRELEESRGKLKIDETPSMVAYGARIGMELGADIVKIKYTGSIESFRWVVKCAYPTKVVMSGGPKIETEDEFISQVKAVMKAGAIGVAVGRNVWQRKSPLIIAKRLYEVIFQQS